jgi:Domain of unknown function (DUF4386)
MVGVLSVATLSRCTADRDPLVIVRAVADPDASAARREAVDIVFHAFNRYLGVAVGQHLGYGLTGAWTTLTGIVLTQTTAAPGWVGVPGIVIGSILMLC